MNTVKKIMKSIRVRRIDRDKDFKVGAVILTSQTSACLANRCGLNGNHTSSRINQAIFWLLSDKSDDSNNLRTIIDPRVKTRSLSEMPAR